MCVTSVTALVFDYPCISGFQYPCSRSQCIINIRNAPTNIEGEVDEQSYSAVLTIVDLAGAEREKKTGNQVAKPFFIVIS